MTIALRTQLFGSKRSVPQTSFGSFRIAIPLLWLILATRLHMANNGGLWLLAHFVESFAVLQAFLAMAQHSTAAASGLTNLDGLTFDERFRLSLRIFWRITLLMFAPALVVADSDYPEAGVQLLLGIIDTAFDQVSNIQKFWSATIAALVLMMIVNAKRDDGEVVFFAAVDEFARRALWLGPAVIVLILAYFVLGAGQEVARGFVLQFLGALSASLFVKNLIYFMYIFGFATLRLWVTLTVLNFGLKQSYVHRN